MSYFDATREFDEALGEIDRLLEDAKASSPGKATHLKAAIVLLGAKLEAYVENIVDEYAKALASRAPKASMLARELKVNSTAHLLSKIRPESKFQPKPNIVACLRAAAELWADDSTISTVPVNNKFNYGKHGSAELASLFERVGITEVYSRCKVRADEGETILDGSELVEVGSDIDSLTHIRNNIIHTDADPTSNFTLEDLHRHKQRIWEFSYQVDLMLQRELDTLDKRMKAA